MNRQSNKNEPLNPNWINPLAPVDSVAERALVACLLDSPKLLPDAWETLGSAEVVADPAYRALLETMYGLFLSGKTVKLSTIIQQLNQSGQISLLVERGIDLMNLSREATLSDYSETASYLRQLWVKRIAIEAASDILTGINAGDDVAMIADKAAALHQSIVSGLSVGVDRSMLSYLSESLTRLDSILNSPGKLTGVETGLRKLNKHLGGWQGADVIMIAGRPGMGKSVAGVFHAYHAAKNGIPVAFLSLEMEAGSLINRMLSMLSGVAYGDIMKGHIDEPQARKIHVAAGEIESLPIHWYDEAGRDVNDLSYKLLNWKQKHGIGLVVIDYVQLLSDRTIRSTEETPQLTSVSKKLKQLQRRLKCPVIELAQLNRSVEDRTNKRGRQSDLRSTGQFEQDASLIVMLYREDYYAEEAAREESEKTGNPIRINRNHKLEYGIVKNRNGYIGTVMLHAEVSLNQIADETPEIPKPSTTYPPVDTANWYEPTKEPTPF